MVRRRKNLDGRFSGPARKRLFAVLVLLGWMATASFSLYRFAVRERFPDHPALHATMSFQEGRVLEATRAFQAALRFDPRLVRLPITREQFWSEFVDAMIETGQSAEIRSLLEARLRIDPDDPVILDRLGVSAAFEGKNEDADAYWQRACEIAPTLAHPWLGRGRLALNRRDASSALTSLERAAALAPDDPETAYGLVSVHRLLGHPDEAARYRRLADRLRSARPQRPRGMDADGGR